MRKEILKNIIERLAIISAFKFEVSPPVKKMFDKSNGERNMLKRFFRSSRYFLYLIMLCLFASGTLYSQTNIVSPQISEEEVAIQGNLQDMGTDANGSFDFETCVCDVDDCNPSPLSCTQNTNIPVTNGNYNYKVNFGTSVWDGNPRWFRIGVRRLATDPYTILSPTQMISASPYAIYTFKAFMVVDNAITSSSILDNAVTSADIANAAITSAKIANDSVNSNHIADNTVTSADIADFAVNSADIANDSVNSNHIADNAVTSAAIADNAVTSSKIAPNVGLHRFSARINGLGPFAGTDVYGAVTGITTATFTETDVQTGTPNSNCNAGNLFVRQTTAPGGGSRTYFLRVNGNDTVLACIISGSDTTCNSAPGLSVNIPGGSDLSFRISTTINPATTDTTLGFECR